MPKSYKFVTSCTLRQGWNFWLKGHSTSPDGGTCIKPFRKIQLKMLPTAATKNAFKLHWKALYLFLEQAPDLNLSEDTRVMSDADVESAFNVCIEFLRLRASYCWNLRGKGPMSWSISTWANRVKRSAILKHGTASDKSLVSEETPRNKAHSRKRTRALVLKNNPKYPRRQRNRLERLELDDERFANTFRQEDTV